MQPAIECSFNVHSFRFHLPLCRVESHWSGRSGCWKSQTPLRRPSLSPHHNCIWQKPPASLFRRTVAEIQIKTLKRCCIIHLFICLSRLFRNAAFTFACYTRSVLTTEKSPESLKGDPIKEKKIVFNGRRLCHIFSVTFNVSSLPLC